MSDPVIPFENLPRGFGDRVDTPPVDPARPRPAATIVLMRDGETGRKGASGPEVLLLRRNRSSGFVPGAYVFPGGRVDAADRDPAIAPRLDGLTPEAAARRLGAPADGVDAIAYYLAAVREAFEETGLLLARAETTRETTREAAREVDDASSWTRGGEGDAAALAARDDLLGERATFSEVLGRLGCRIAGDALEYIAHWITPEAEPRRYDTRFFAAVVARDRRVSLDAREMTDALWLTPAQALASNAEGALPMVFPTLKTLESLRDFATPADAIAGFRGRPVKPILPRLVRTPTGIGIRMPEE